MKKSLLAAASISGATLAGAANAAVDITAVTSGITDASTALVSLVGALLALSVAMFGMVKVYRFVSKKSGA